MQKAIVLIGDECKKLRANDVISNFENGEWGVIVPENKEGRIAEVRYPLIGDDEARELLEKGYLVLIEDEEKEPPTSTQIGGSHYQHFKIQPIEFILQNELDFPTGNVIKYVCRHGFKNGKEDLEKAKHYIDLLIHEKYGNSNKASKDS